MKNVIKSIVTLFIRLTPKFNYCFFKGMPTYEDSLVALYQELPIERFDKIIWSCYDTKSPFPTVERGKTIFVQKGSIKEFFYGVFSKYILTTHGHFVTKVPANQTCINVWHGMPLKAVGKLDNQPSRQDSYLCSTSEVYQDILSRAFEMPLERVPITGTPRNDLLFQEDRAAELFSKAGINQDQYDKIFIWLPTYRKSVLGYITEDGTEVDNVFSMKDFPVLDFQDFLEDNNCLCIVKQHPMAPQKELQDVVNIKMITEDWLWERELNLYSLLGLTDFLISDISSVMTDYMLTDKPIVVCFEDSEEYKDSRQMIFENIEEWLPANISSTYDQLKSEIQQILEGRDPYREKRMMLQKKFHQYIDDQSCKRVLDLIKKH